MCSRISGGQPVVNSRGRLARRQNLGGVLPVKLTGLKVAVVGPLAGCAPNEPQPCTAQSAMAGGYNPAPARAQIVTVAAALGARLPAGAMEVVLATGTAAGVLEAANASAAADLAVVVVG